MDTNHPTTCLEETPNKLKYEAWDGLRVETLTTGNELLEGEWRDEHSRHIALKLLEHDIRVSRFNTVGDSLEDLTHCLHEVSQRADLCVITGGLGPTCDDLTLDALASASGGTLNFDQALWGDLLLRFPRLARAPESNQRQARILDGAQVLPNPMGTAYALNIQINRCLFFAFPGVPKELHWCVDNLLIPFVQKTSPPKFERRVLRIALIGESEAAERISKLPLPENLEIGFQALGTEHRVKLRAPTASMLENCLPQIKAALGVNYLNDQDQPLIEQVVEYLEQHHLSVGFAESCTGGRLGAALTALPGVSKVFNGSIVSYSNHSKTSLLDVSEHTLSQYGAVSLECAREMAIGARAKLAVDWAISVTGIAGPSGGSPQKPVGTVCFAWAGPAGVEMEEKFFHGDRDRIQNTATAFALFELLRRVNVSLNEMRTRL